MRKIRDSPMQDTMRKNTTDSPHARTMKMTDHPCRYHEEVRFPYKELHEEDTNSPMTQNTVGRYKQTHPMHKVRKRQTHP
ncbi:hypothetical protein NP493_6912g00000 [Ridgeia piscesae]|uniref:Uncharacterized protein n=1 Tax=Ridgeia piscesae TaxID=27915 RepID=A0AAD9MLZ7_RIDPI|nr:hypothetical protein NP493_6912g00000 [Ridgeia piscesae]